MTKIVRQIYGYYLYNDAKTLLDGKQYKPFIIKHYQFFLGMWETLD